MANGADFGVVLLAVLGIVGSMMAAIVMYAARYRKVPPNTAMIVYGRRSRDGKGFQVVTGGAKFIVPIVESFTTLPLSVQSLNLVIESVPTRDSVVSKVQVNAEVRICPDTESVEKAATALKDGEELQRVSRQVLQDAARRVLEGVPVDAMTRDAVALSDKVRDVAKGRLDKLGIEIVVLALP